MESLQDRNVAKDYHVNLDDEMNYYSNTRLMQDPQLARKDVMISTAVQARLTIGEVDSVLSVFLSWRLFEAPNLPKNERDTYAITLENGQVVYVIETDTTLSLKIGEK